MDTRFGSFYDKFPTGTVYTIEFEDGTSTEAHESDLELNREPFHLDESWLYNLAHFHLDPKNDEPREAVAALFDMFAQAVEQTRRWTRPSNVWLLFVPAEPEESAVYVHSENPYGTPFPFQFEGVSWDVPPPEILAVFVQREHQVGLSRVDQQLYWVRMRPRSESTQS